MSSNASKAFDSLQYDDETQLNPTSSQCLGHDKLSKNNPNVNNLYSHTADNIYDSGGHHKLQDRNEETYDHFFGKQTEVNFTRLNNALM